MIQYYILPYTTVFEPQMPSISHAHFARTYTAHTYLRRIQLILTFCCYNLAAFMIASIALYTQYYLPLII